MYHYEIDIIDETLEKASHALETAGKNYCANDGVFEPDDTVNHHLNALLDCFQRCLRGLSDIRSSSMAEMNLVCTFVIKFFDFFNFQEF